jgi:hypothetical protein
MKDPDPSLHSGRQWAGVMWQTRFQEDKIMVEELEKEYALLKDKVRELREYL